MKMLRKNIMALLAMLPLGFVSCVDEVQRVEGEPELDGCYKVYFPTQENSGALEFAPEDTPSVTFKIRREVENDDIVVPVKVISSEDGIFDVSEVSFNDGQTESTFTVSFPKAEIGNTYSCTVCVDDPQYASVYSQRSNFLSFSVVRVKWDLVVGKDGSKKGLYRDDLFSSAYNLSGEKFAEHEVSIYERSDKPGYYKIENLYDVPFMQTLFGRPGVDLSSWFIGPQVVYIDATDPNKVWIPWTELNMLLSSEDGAISFGSDVQENQIVLDQMGGAHGYYGTLEDGVLTFPYRGLYIGFGGEIQAYANNNDMFRLLFPGAKVVDYAVSVTAGFADNGVLPVSFTLGADVAKVKYDVYEGRLSAEDAAAKAREIAANSAAEFVTETSTVGIRLNATGVYTVVTANLDAAGTIQGSSNVSFGYVAADDTVPVVVNAGLIVSDKYAQLGYTSENSVEFYIYGQELNRVYYGLYKSSDIQADAQAVLADLLKNGLASSEELEAINGEGLSDLFIKLNSGTEYTLLVYAENDYDAVLIQKSAKTEGVVDPLQAVYTADDVYVAEEKASFYGNYKYYAKVDDATSRALAGDVVVSDGGSEMTDDGEVHYVSIKGLFSPAVNDGFLKDDTVTWEAYQTNSGYWIIYSLGNVFGQLTLNGKTYYAAQLTVMADGKGGIVDNGFVAGFTEDGNIAIVDSQIYSSYGGAFCLQLQLFNDSAYQSSAGYLYRFADMLLVDPENLNATASSAVAAPSYDTMGLTIKSTPYNCVETVRTQVRRRIEDLVKVKTAGIYRGAGIKTDGYSASDVPFSVSVMTTGNNGDNMRNTSNVIR